MTVAYDPQVVGFEALVTAAKSHGCTDAVWVRTQEEAAIAQRIAGAVVAITQDAARTSKASDLLYYLRQHDLRFVPLSELQRMRVNADLGQKRDPSRWLSPRQAALFARLQDPEQRKALGQLEVLPPLDALWRLDAR